MKSDGGVITPCAVTGGKSTAKLLQKRLRSKQASEEKQRRNIQRKSARSIRKAGAKPISRVPPDSDEPADLIEEASYLVVGEEHTEELFLCACRSGCPACRFVQTLEMGDLALEQP